MASLEPFWLGQALLEAGAITGEQLASARQLWRQNPRQSFASVLEFLGLAGPRELAGLTADHHGLPLAGLSEQTLDRAAVRLLPLATARQKCLLPYRQSEGRLHLAVEDPAAYTVQQARRDFPGCEVCLHVAPRREILAWLEEAWRDPGGPANANEAFAALVRAAAAERTTDLHLEPRENSLEVRQRIDGRLVHRSYVAADLREPLLQAAKLAGRMDIAERRLPQDGQGSLLVGGRHYHLRFSSLPAVAGESIVIRIIDEQAGLRSFADMGLLPADEAQLRALLELPNGLVYVTGPTGSGKTTLLHSMLHNLPASRRHQLKIITLEDPVEIRHPRYFLQINVDDRVGRTFGEVLRHVLRHDPDVVMVGETRDRTTAEITLRAALAGRLCFSTLHTNDALGAVARLTDIGLDPLMLASALRGAIAQRLVRRPCPDCRRPHPQRDLFRQRFGAMLDPAAPADFVAAEAGRACPLCRGRGYHGRTTLIEVCPLGGLERLIAERAPAAAFQAALRARGGRTLFEDGARKAGLGLTTMEEVYAAVDAPDRLL